jgi:hypothetical protein
MGRSALRLRPRLVKSLRKRLDEQTAPGTRCSVGEGDEVSPAICCHEQIGGLSCDAGLSRVWW